MDLRQMNRNVTEKQNRNINENEQKHHNMLTSGTFTNLVLLTI